MSFLETMKADLEKLAGNTGDAVEGLMKKIEDRAVALRADIMQEIDAKFEALRAEIIGKAESVPSAAVADLGKAVASIGIPVVAPAALAPPAPALSLPAAATLPNGSAPTANNFLNPQITPAGQIPMAINTAANQVCFFFNNVVHCAALTP